MSDVVVKELSVYPVKACQGVAMDEIKVTRRGIDGDRVFVLWHDGQLIDQVETPQVGALSVAFDPTEGTLAFSHPEIGDFEHKIRNRGETLAATWQLDKFDTLDQGDEVGEWLSNAIERNIRLVSARKPWKKNLPLPQFELVHDKPTNRFYAATPVSLSNAASLDELNTKLESPVPMDRFRMNVIVDGLEPWAEDNVVTLSSDSVTLQRVTHCERCIITTTDQKTGERTNSDLLKVLGKYRKREEDRFASGLLFGAYMTVSREGVLRVGDRLAVESRVG